MAHSRESYLLVNSVLFKLAQGLMSNKSGVRLNTPKRYIVRHNLQHYFPGYFLTPFPFFLFAQTGAGVST